MKAILDALVRYAEERKLIAPEDRIWAFNRLLEVMQADIESFSYENELDAAFVSRITHEYFIDTRSVTKEYLRVELQQQGVKGLLRITEYIKRLNEFLENSYNKFTAEGE